MSLSLDDVRHVAGLARLALTEAEATRLRDQLQSILGHMEILNELDTAAIPPTAQVIASASVMRPDEPADSLPRETALANAPEQEDGYFRVDAVLDVES